MNRTKVIYINAVVALSLIFLGTIQQTWTRNPIGWLDPYTYFNYFIPELDITSWENYYKKSRVPWNFVGRTIYNLTGIENINFIIALFSLSLYMIFSNMLARRFNVSFRVYLVSGFLLLPFFHGHFSGGWTYHNSLSSPLQILVYFLVLELVYNHKQNKSKNLYRFFIVTLSAVSVILISTNIMQSLTILPAIAYVVYLSLKNKKFFDLVIFSIISSLTTFFIIGITSKYLGYEFFYPRTMILMYKWLNGPEKNHLIWYEPLSSGWISKADYLVFPTTIFIISLVTLFFKSKDLLVDSKIKFLALLLILNHVLVYCIFWAAYFLYDVHLLNMSYQTQPIYVTAMVSLASNIFIFQDRFRINSKEYLIWLLPLSIVLYLAYQPFTISADSIYIKIIILIFFYYFIIFSSIKLFKLNYLNFGIFFVLVLALYPGINTAYKDNLCQSSNILSISLIEIVKDLRTIKEPIHIIIEEEDYLKIGRNCSTSIRLLADSLTQIGPVSTPILYPQDLIQLNKTGVDYRQKIIFIKTSANLDTELIDQYLRLNYFMNYSNDTKYLEWQVWEKL